MKRTLRITGYKILRGLTMKTIFKISIITCVLMTVAPLFALNVIVGAKAGYFVWHPYFQEMDGSGIEQIDKGDGVLYGPVASMILSPDISFSVVALTGRQSTHWTDDNRNKKFADDDIIANGTYYADILRYDVDSALSYRLSRQFKIFFGYKYQYTETVLRGEFRANAGVNNESVYEGDVQINIPSHGPAIGIGYSVAGDIFFSTVNLSAVYMWSKFELERNVWIKFRPSGTEGAFIEDPPIDGSGHSFEMKQIGFNLEPSVGLKVEEVIVTLGFRFQWMRNKFVDDPVIGDGRFAPTGWMNDYLYGMVVSLMYMF